MFTPLPEIFLCGGVIPAHTKFLFMKKLILGIAVMMVMVTAAIAQRGAHANSDVRIQQTVDAFSEKHPLTDMQKADMKKVMNMYHEKRKALGREAGKDQHKALRMEKTANLQHILGDDLYAAFREFRKEQRQTQMEKRRKHRTEGQRHRQGEHGKERPQKHREQRQ